MSDTSPYMIAAFNSVRTEIIERMKLRDQALFVYIAGVAAYFSFSFSTQKEIEGKCVLTSVEYFLFLPLPIFSVIMTLTILHHHIFIEKLWRYLRNDLSKESPIVFWDWSTHPKEAAPTLGYNRTVAQFLCLVLPLCYELFVLAGSGATCLAVESLGAKAFRAIMIMLCVFSSLYIARLHIHAHRFRKEAYKP